MGAVLELTQDNLQETIEKNEMVFIDFWASWCGPCRAFAPIFESVAAKNPDIKFAKLNTEEEQEVAAKFGIRSIPTLAIFKDKEMIFFQPGMLPEDALQDVANQVRQLNMEQARKEAT